MTKPDEFRYAKELAMSIYKRHWEQDSPKFELEDNLYGVLMQIDNMTCGLTRKNKDICKDCEFKPLNRSK